MTTDLYNRVWSSPRRGTRKLLLLALARFAYGDDYGVCWPSIATLAQMIGENEDWTEVLTKQAEADGDVFRKPGRGRGNTTIYGIAIDLPIPDRQRLAVLVAATTIRKKQRLLTIDGKTLPYTPDAVAELFDQLAKGVLQPPFSGAEYVENPDGDAENIDPPTVEEPAPPPPPPRPATTIGRSARRPPPLPEQIRWLLYDEGITTAEDFRNAPDLDALIADYKARRAENQPKGTIVKFWKQYGAPTQETMYRGRQDQENQPERSSGVPARPAARQQRRPRPGDPGYYQ